MRMKKPEKHAMSHWIYGIDVKDKEIVEVPEHLVSLFKEEGFEVVEEEERPKKGKRTDV